MSSLCPAAWSTSSDLKAEKMPPADVLYIARHGQGHCNVGQAVGGPQGCTGLTRPGRQQADRLAARLQLASVDQPIQAIICSPVKRVVETAHTVGNRLGVEVTIDDDLREQDYGHADADLWADAVIQHGGLPSQWPDRPFAGGETWNEYQTRATQTIQRILRAHTMCTLVIGHMVTVDNAIRAATHMPQASHVAFRAAYASVTRLSRHHVATLALDDDVWTVDYTNSARHLGHEHNRSPEHVLTMGSP